MSYRYPTFARLLGEYYANFFVKAFERFQCRRQAKVIVSLTDYQKTASEIVPQNRTLPLPYRTKWAFVKSFQ
jgi:hypothetical protein